MQTLLEEPEVEIVTGSIIPLTAAQQHLVAENRKLVGSTFKMIRCRASGRDEVMAAGYVALCEAAQKFDVTLGFKFSTYAVNGIRLAMITEIRKLYRRQQSDTVDVTNGDGDALADAIESPDTAVDIQIAAKELWAKLDLLPQNLALAIKGNMEGKTTRELAIELGCSNASVANWQRKGMEMLKEMVGAE